MTYQTFKEHILTYMKEHFQNACQIFIQPVLKNNGQVLDGLIILPQQLNIAPTLYLNFYYEQLKNGHTLEQICTEICRHYEINCPHTSIDIAFFTDFKKVRSHIAYKLINHEKNSALLKDVPHIRFLDLAIVFYCLIPSIQTQYASILIHNQHLDFWNVSAKELFDLASENTPKLQGYSFENITRLLHHLTFGSDEEPDETSVKQSSYPLFVLSSKNHLYGASCILYQDLLYTLAQKADMDFYILPSSIHEVILIPTQDDRSFKELSAMVKEINQSEVSPEDVLSNHAYYYSKEKNEITFQNI